MDSSYEETDWFYPDQLPVRPGVYKTKQMANAIICIKPIEGYSKWDGRFWHPTQSTPGRARNTQYAGTQQTKMWKGIVRNEYQDGTN